MLYSSSKQTIIECLYLDNQQLFPNERFAFWLYLRIPSENIG